MPDKTMSTVKSLREPSAEERMQISAAKRQYDDMLANYRAIAYSPKQKLAKSLEILRLGFELHYWGLLAEKEFGWIKAEVTNNKEFLRAIS